MAIVYSVFVPGRPGSAGSKTIFPRKGGGKPIVAPASKYTKPWQDSVRWLFLQTYGRPVPLLGPIQLNITFFLKRPKSHYRLQKGQEGPQLKAQAPIYHTSRPDTSKLVRSTEDSLTGLVWQDDSQVALITAKKIYADGPTGADIEISTIEKGENL